MRVPMLVHVPTGSYFIFDYNHDTDTHDAIYGPGLERPEDRQPPSDWNGQSTYVRVWLMNLKREYEAPDLWSELRRQQALVGGELPEIENTPFTPDEQAQIQAHLKEAKAYIRQAYELPDEQYRAIEARLDYLVDASRRLGRIDWRNALVGAFLGAVVQATLSPEPVRDILGLVMRGLAHLFGVHVPALPHA